MKARLIGFIVISALCVAPAQTQQVEKSPASGSIELPAEKHLRNVRQLTFGGENAEAQSTQLNKHESFAIQYFSV